MFKIEDGRESFYQWDIDRRLIIEDSSINEVHFCNRTDSCSLVVDTYLEDNKCYANVPNILLQTDWKINVYAYNGKYTKFSACYKVLSRTKPADYIYTETEIKNFDTIERQMAIVTEMAKGANRCKTFDTYADMVEHFNSAPLGSYVQGQDVRIITLNVPDLWVAYEDEESAAYTYTNDEAIVDALAADGFVKVGFYRLGALESQKVNLIDYIKKAELTSNTLNFTEDEKAGARAALGALKKPKPNAGGYYQVPAVTADNKDVQLSAFNAPLQYAVALYGTGGVLSTNEPTKDNNCVNLKYLNTRLENIVEEVIAQLPNGDGVSY